MEPTSGTGAAKWKTHILIVAASDAAAMRSAIRCYWLDGVQAEESRYWLLWRRFVINGPELAVHKLLRDHERDEQAAAEDRII